MSKTLETKKKILDLLRQKDMTISGLSAALGLSTATVSQHMEELSRTGAVERIENEHFRKLKYYRIRGAEARVLNRYVTYLIAAALVSAALLGFYFNGLTYVVPGAANIPLTGIPPNLVAALNASRAYGFNLTQGMFRSNSSSECVLVRVSFCDNNVPSQFACINSDYYQDYIGQRQAAFSGQGEICPQYLLAGTISCASAGGYCEVVPSQVAMPTPS